MKFKRLAVCVVTFLALVVWGNTYTLAGETGSAPDTLGIADDQIRFIPDLMGTWDVQSEFYEHNLSTGLAAYDSDSLILVITEQTGHVFTGYEHEVGEQELGNINGAVVRRSVRLGGIDLVMTGTLVAPNIIVGTYSNVPIVEDDDDYETGAFIARRRVARAK